MRYLLMILVVSINLLFANEVKELQYLGNIKNIIISTQKIRGGTYNFLNGSDFAQFGVYKERSLQKNYFKNLDKSYRIAGKKLDMSFDTLRIQTKSLNKISFQLEPIDSFRAYSTLINKMITTNQEARDTFFKKSDPMIKSTVSIMVDSLIPLSEGLGKLRGLGSGIIARSYCEEEEVDMMYAYILEIQKSLSSLSKKTKLLYKNHANGYTKNMTKNLDNLIKEVREYKLFAKLKVINKTNIKENSNTYFDRGTGLITKVMELYRLNENMVKHAITSSEVAYF